MASPVGERNAQADRPRRVGLISLPAPAIVLTAMLVAGCGGGSDPHANVEAGLQHYFSTFNPEDSIFPFGAGPPRVKGNGCKDLHRKFLQPGSIMLRKGKQKGEQVIRPGSIMMSKGEQKDDQTVALWQCFVRFEDFTLTVQVAVNDSNEVVWAVPVYGDPRKAPKLSPARTYTG
jgi:hypothetical protein